MSIKDLKNKQNTLLCQLEESHVFFFLTVYILKNAPNYLGKGNPKTGHEAVVVSARTPALAHKPGHVNPHTLPLENWSLKMTQNQTTATKMKRVLYWG